MHPTGASLAPEAEVQAMHSMDWLFKKERIYLLAQFWQQRATLAEKEVTTLKEQLATHPIQSKTNGSVERLEFSPIKEEVEEKMEARSGSARSSPQALESELAAKEKERERVAAQKYLNTPLKPW
ncbi:homeobox protein cut-like [Leguminivora glycinivorella]|uniref:homeobox protein cut-like n=1 Tax=Leguminivora glycinivorella TaxID=1035111 RepID=UPI002010750A|nr:homeobox protein cut-like [Leguminivora glycinivorella]